MHRVFHLAIFVVLSLAATAVWAQTPIWRSDWTTLDSQRSFNAPAVYTGDGEVILVNVREYDAEIVRLTASGGVRWSTNVTGYFEYDQSPAIATHDGGAVVVRAGGVITKIGANGQLAWEREWPGYSRIPGLAVAPSGDILVASCVTPKVGAISSLDAANGDMRWQRTVSEGISGCGWPTISVNPSGSLYVLFTRGSANTVQAAARLTKFDHTGSFLWGVNLATGTSGSGPALFSPAAEKVYLWSSDGFLALDGATGTNAWQLTDSSQSPSSSKLVAFAGSSSDPILISGGMRRRRAANDGRVLWQLSGASASAAAIVDGDIVTRYVNGVARIDADSGEVIWNRVILGDWFSNYYSVGLLGDAVGFVVPRSATNGQFRDWVFRLDAADGTSLGRVEIPDTQQPVLGVSVLDGEAHMVQAGVSTTKDRLFVRRLETTLGSVDWERVVSDIPENYRVINPQIMLSTESIMAIAELESSWGSPYFGKVMVASFERTTGNARWSAILGTFQQQTTYASEPTQDAQGNVYLTVGTKDVCPTPKSEPYCPRYTLYKLGGTAGSVLWKQDRWLPILENIVRAPSLVAVGGDIVVDGAFGSTMDSRTLARLSGSDGSTVVWNSAPLSDFAILQITQPGPERILVRGFVAGSVRWTELDPASGLAEWTTSGPRGCPTPQCLNLTELFLPNGDALFGGYDLVQLNAWITRMKLDGTGQSSHWIRPRPDTRQRSSVSSLTADPDPFAMPWMVLQERWTSSQGLLRTLGRLDNDIMMPTDRQLLGLSSTDSLRAAAPSNVLRMDVNSALVDGQIGGGGHPLMMSAAKYDTTASAHGDVRVSVAVNRGSAMPGQELDYTATVSYSGDVPIEGATLLLYLPWQGATTALACTVADAANCTFNDAGSVMSANFDLSPGGTVVLSGTLRVTQVAEGAYVAATVAGPMGLLESDSANNFASAVVGQSLFADDFESTSH